MTALLVARSTTDPDATLEIVGRPVIASYASALHRFVAEAGLDEAITFRGHASDADVAAAYARADVLVVASVHEGFGVPLVEAMSVGLPIVVSSAGALPEVVGEAGVVTDDRTIPGGSPAPSRELLGDRRAVPRPGGGGPHATRRRSIWTRPGTGSSIWCARSAELRPGPLRATFRTSRSPLARATRSVAANRAG